MSTVTIKVRDNGSFFVEGPVTIVDAVGNKFEIPANKPGVGLCRCGQSARKPFCDGAHKACNFAAAERAPTPEGAVAPPAAPPSPPLQQLG